MKMLRLLLITALTWPVVGNNASAEEVDQLLLEEGRLQYVRNCQSCHALDPAGGSLGGPNLHGIFGSEVGADPRAIYSASLLRSGVVWTSITMNEWVENPAEFIPGNTMAFVGIREERARLALVEFLRVATATPQRHFGAYGER